jgi:hypothetical protein
MPDNTNLPKLASETTQRKPAADISAQKTNHVTNSSDHRRALPEGGST